MEGSPSDRAAAHRAGSADRREGREGAYSAGARREGVRGLLLDVPAHAGDRSGAARGGGVGERRRGPIGIRRSRRVAPHPSELVAQPELPLPWSVHTTLQTEIRNRGAGGGPLAAVEACKVVPIEDVEGLRAYTEPPGTAYGHDFGQAHVHGPVHVVPRRHRPNDPMRTV